MESGDEIALIWSLYLAARYNAFESFIAQLLTQSFGAAVELLENLYKLQGDQIWVLCLVGFGLYLVTLP